MNKLHKRLVDLHFLPTQEQLNSDKDGITIDGFNFEITTRDLILCSIIYNVIDIHFIIDRNFNRIDIYREDEYDFDGNLIKSRELAKIPNYRRGDIIETNTYLGGLRIFFDIDDNVIFVELCRRFNIIDMIYSPYLECMIEKGFTYKGHHYTWCESDLVYYRDDVDDIAIEYEDVLHIANKYDNRWYFFHFDY